MEPEEEVVVPEDDKEAVDTTPVVSDEQAARLEKAEQARRQLTARAKEAEAKLRAAEEKLKLAEDRINGGNTTGLAVEEFIDISTSLDGLDQREKAFLAEQHRLTGKKLSEIRESEDFQLWDSAYLAKLEREAALKPSTTQEVEDVPKSLEDRLRSATIAEKEKLLIEAGLYREPRSRIDRVNIGDKRTG